MTVEGPRGVAGDLTGTGPAGTALAEEARRLRLLLDRLPSLIGYWDADLRNVIANEAYLEYFGLTPEQARGRHLRDVLGEAVYALNLPYVEGALAGREQLFERTLVDQRGVNRHTQASYIPDVVDGQVRGFYVQVTDVTARVEAEHARDEAQRLFHISMANAPFGKAVLDTSARILYINPSLCALLGHTAAELEGRDFRELVHPDDRADAESDLARLQKRTVMQISTERRYVRQDGTTVWMQRNAVLVPGAHGGHDVIVAQFQDVTARRDAEAELARLALTDPLTGLQNRRALTERVVAFQEAHPYAEVGVVFIDLDGLKDVNDVHGHDAGDAVLVHAAGLLAGIVAEPHSAYRLGGDEFVVLAPCPGEIDVAALAARIRATLTDTYPTPTARLPLTASVGWTWGAAGDVEALLCRADADMYRQKPARYRHPPIDRREWPTPRRP